MAFSYSGSLTGEDHVYEAAFGKPTANIDALVDSLGRVARMVTDFRKIAELDINPLAVETDNVIALDARAI